MFKRKIYSDRFCNGIDFLLARKNKVCPIEIKSSGYKAHASLDAFTQKFSDKILWRYLVYTKDLLKMKISYACRCIWCHSCKNEQMGAFKV